MRKNRFRIALKIAVTAAFLLWIIFSVDWKKVLFYFKQLDIWWMFAFLAVYTLGIAISSYKWKILADFRGIRAPFKELFKVYLTGIFINNFFPSIIGGDAYRSYKLGKFSGNRYIEATSTVLVDRISGLMGVMMLIVFFSLLNFSFLVKNQVLLSFNAIILASFAALGIVIMTGKTFIGEYIKKFIPQKITDFLSAIGVYAQYRILGKSLIGGVIFNFIGVGLATWMLFLDLHIAISFSDFIVAISIVSIVSSIPINIGNIGIKEWAFITFFGIYGVNGEAALSIAIFARFLQMMVSFSAVPFYLREKSFLESEK